MRSIGRIIPLILAVAPLLATPDGGRIYNLQCARCHGNQGSGDGPAHTMQRPWPRDFTLGQYKFRSTPLNTLPTQEDVAQTIRKGILRSSMPAFEKFLSPEEIDAVARYVWGLSRKTSKLPPGRPFPRPRFLDLPSALTSEKLMKGRALFLKECASCHGADGRGFGPEAPNNRDEHGFWIQAADLTDPLSYGGGAQASEIFLRLKTGVPLSSMPRFGQYLTDPEMQDIALYVKSLQISSETRPYIDRQSITKNWPASLRGEYLTRAMSCTLCHNAYDKNGHYYPDLYLAGGVAITIPGLGVYPTRNLTSHPTDGLGRWNEGDIVRVLKTGHAPDRQIEAFAMPWPFFSSLTDDDAQDIAAYLKNLRPIANKVPPRHLYSFWRRLLSRFRQLVDLESGRLEYPPFNIGERGQ